MRNKMNMKHWNPGKIVIVLLLTVFAAYIAIPFLWMLATSLRSPLVSFRLPPSLIPTTFDLANYRQIFIRVNFFAFIKNSIYVSVMITGTQIIVVPWRPMRLPGSIFPERISSL
jgi:multiple sugar transport system permease protein